MKDASIELEDLVTLKAYLEKLIDERDRQYDARFKASEIAVNAALAAQEKAVTAAFTASEKAIVKAEDAQKDYNARSNEFRGQLDDQAKMLMPRIETTGLFKAVDDKFIYVQQSFEQKQDQQKISVEKVFDSITKDIASLRESRSTSQGKGEGYNNVWVVAVAIAAIIAVFVSKLIK